MNARSRLESVEALLRNAPPVPAVVLYYDDFSDSYGQVTHASASDHWTISFDGRNATLDFGRFDIARAMLLWPMTWKTGLAEEVFTAAMGFRYSSTTLMLAM